MVKNRPAKAGNVRDAALTPLSARSPEKGMAADSSVLAWRISDSGAWQATVHGVAKSQTRLSN